MPRLRRLLTATALCSVGSLALVLGSSVPPAYGFGASGIASVAAGASVSLTAGATGESAPEVTLLFADNSTTSVWNAGDRITFQLWDATANAPLSDTSANSLDSAGFAAAPAVGATNGLGTSAYSLNLTSGATSSTDDEFVLTLNQNAPLDSNDTAFTFAGLSLDLGTRVPLGHVVALKAAASNGTPFVGSSATQTVELGSIPGITVTASQEVTGSPSSTGVILANVVMTDVAGGAIGSGDQIGFTLAYGAKFDTPGTVGGSLVAAGAPTITTSTTPNDTVVAAATRTSAANDTVSLGGASVTLPSVFGELYVAVYDRTTATLLGDIGVASIVNQTRIGGGDRYATAVAIFGPQFSAVNSVVLASGTNFPDALSADYLASQLGTGVLTTDPGTLSAETRQELTANSIATVYLLGGTSAVSQAVQNQVAALRIGDNPNSPLIKVVRIAGADRYATNNLVDTYKLSLGSGTAIIATGSNFADALAVGPAVYETGYPLILTDGSVLSASAKQTIADLDVKRVVILGGDSAISSAVQAALVSDGVSVEYRIAGADRTQTAADIADWETSGLLSYGSYAALGSLGFSGVRLVNVARGDNFADALAAGPVAGAQQHAVLLTNSPNSVGSGPGLYLGGKAGSVTTLQALGLSSAVSAATLNAAAESLTKPLII